METFGTEHGFCAQTVEFWQLIGNILLVLKIIIPVILIVIGIITLGKAVISTDDKDMKNGFNSIIKKFVTAVLIFFLPTIITTLFGIVNGFEDLKSDYNVCQKCISNPKGDFCQSKVIAISTDA
ncbi:MAG: hypothetical protein E7167_03315 [Firmicutes bacterium]|nr:hypothetical protein [Bacillota bacterium]